MPKTIKFRDLLANEVELRVGATNESGFSLLLYKTARTDANILDETVGAFNWQKRFYQVKNTMICSLGINMNYNDETKEPLWIWKDDAGDESNTEAIKGEASDSFKRAGFAYSIGRKLYESPFVWIKKDQDNDPKKTHYSVKTIEYDETKVTKLVITNDKTGQVVFQFGTSGNSKSQTTTPPKASYTPSDIANTHEENITLIGRYLGKLDNDRYVKFFDWIEKSYGIRDYKQLSVEQAQKVISVWKMK